MIILTLLLFPLILIPAAVIYVLRQNSEEPVYQRYAMPKDLDSIKLVDLPEGICLSSDVPKKRQH